MNCRKCGIKCSGIISINKISLNKFQLDTKTCNKFCEECKCGNLCHYDSSFSDEFPDNLIEDICSVNKSMLKNIEEVSRLAKTFGVTWLPIGIQPSEVDRFLKYFPVNNEIRKSLFVKSETRSTAIQVQIPIHDRSRNNMVYVTGAKEIDRCNNFIAERKDKTNVGRLDHLDKSEGKACNECSEIISFGEMCVMLPKPFQKVSLVWHPNCFKCIQCQNTLIDYFFCWDNRDDNGPYCLRHFDDRHFPRCCSCDELIFEDEYASVLDDSFHTKHLRCSVCDEILVNTQFMIDTDSSSPSYKLWKCIACSSVPKTDSCFICKTVLDESPNSIIIDGMGAHKTCISCDTCQQLLPISDPSSLMKEDINQLSCLNCQSTWKLGLCQHCKEAVDLNDNSNIVNGRFVWHQQCLQCSLCKKSILEGDQFTVIDKSSKVSRVSKPNFKNASAICKECFISKHEDKCEICFKRLDNEGVKYQSRLFHKSCFKCHNCLSDLDPIKFTTKDDEFYCVTCYGQLFCNTCFSCKCPIFVTEDSSKMVNFETRYWHEKCFICFSCHRSLIECGFLFGDDRISCIECDMK